MALERASLARHKYGQGSAERRPTVRHVTPEEAFAKKEGMDVGPCHFWCNLTQTVVGPDDRPVHKHDCAGERACFRE
jgi:hypothetical protein